MEPIWIFAKREIEALLDQAVERAAEMPEGPQKDEITRRINELDELLLAETNL